MPPINPNVSFRRWLDAIRVLAGPQGPDGSLEQIRELLRLRSNAEARSAARRMSRAMGLPPAGRFPPAGPAAKRFARPAQGHVRYSPALTPSRRGTAAKAGALSEALSIEEWYAPHRG